MPEPLRPSALVFDVYETLLDMNEVQRKINLLLDSKRAYIIWFELFMQYCFVNNSLDTFHDFLSIARATLQMTGSKLGRTISDTEADDVLQLLKHLPVREEVEGCLSELNDEGYTIIALTNAPEKVVCERMERTGLISFFQNVLSAEMVKKYKPEKRVYEFAAQKLGEKTGDMLMITSHLWDVAGASNAGMKTAFLTRGKQPVSMSIQPDVSTKTLSELVSILKKTPTDQTEMGDRSF